MEDVEVMLGRRVGKRKMAEASAELERIRLKYGRLTSQLVLTETMKLGKKSPIAWAFDWDLKSAARKHWLSQAGHLIREVQVRLVRAPEDGVPSAPFRAYAFVREPHGGHYLPMAQALSDATVRAQLVQQALADVQRMRIKFKSLSELIVHLDSAEKELKRSKRKKSA